jgi:hypothetical protein
MDVCFIGMPNYELSSKRALANAGLSPKQNDLSSGSERPKPVLGIGSRSSSIAGILHHLLSSAPDGEGVTLCDIDHSDSEPCPHDWILASRVVDERTEGWMAYLFGDCGVGLRDL